MGRHCTCAGRPCQKLTPSRKGATLAFGGMATFSRFFGSRDDVPEWAKFFEPSEYRAFMEAVEAEFRRRRVRARVDEGIATLQRRGASPQQCGLLNLAQMCHQLPRADWAEVVRAHFDSLFDPASQGEALDGLDCDFDRARGLLKVRLYPEDASEAMERAGAVYRSPFAQVIEALVYDFPHTVATVHADHLKAWGRPADEIFALGTANVRTSGKIAPQAFPLDGGGSLGALTGESFFTATHALFLADYLGAAPRGALVSVPHRHTILYHRIDDLTAVKAIQAMLVAGFGMFQEGPGSISPHLYWWRDGRYTLLPSKVTAKSIDFEPPEEFVDLLNGLAEPS